MPAKTNTKNKKRRLLTFAYAALFLSNYLAEYYSDKMHHLLKQNSTLELQPLSAIQNKIHLASLMFLFLAILIIIFIQNYNHLSLKSILSRTTWAFFPIAIIRLILSLAFKNFSFTGVSFIIEMGILYLLFLIIGTFLFLLRKYKIHVQQLKEM